MSIPEQVLTRDKWTDFCVQNFHNDHISHDYWRDLFDQVKDSRIIVSSFLKYPFETKVMIVRHLRFGIPEQTISKYLELCRRVSDTLPAFKGCESMQFFQISQIIEREIGALSDDFFDEMLDVLYLHKKRTNGAGQAWPGMIDTVVYLLLVFYSEELVMDALKRWSSHSSGIDPYYLILLAENWDESKDFPVDWAINIMNTEGL